MSPAQNWDDASPVEENYAVADGVVFIDVVVGNGQFGSISIWLDDTNIGAGTNTAHAKVGAGGQIKGKELVVAAVVHDVNPATNRTVVTFALSGGPSAASYQSEGMASRDYGVVIHPATFTLV